MEGLCRYTNRNIYINNCSNYNDLPTDAKLRSINITIRHEVLHAFLAESGLLSSGVYNNGWAENEEMIDWFACQAPKIYKVYKELEVLED